MRATYFLLSRYLFPERSNLLGLALWISVAGVALGIVQLMLVLSVMSGFQKFLQDNYTRITSEIIVIPRQSREKDPAFRQALTGIKGIEAVTPFAVGQGMIIKGGVGGVVLEGTDLETSGKVTPWKTIWVAPPNLDEQEKDPHWIWIGAQLAKKLEIKQGETVNVLIADGDAKKVIPFKVTAITRFGIYDHDLHYARIDLGVLSHLFRRKELEPMYKTRLTPGLDLAAAAERVKDTMGHMAVVKQWSEINQNVFLAVQHQKKLLFLVLEIVVALAAMNVVNLLMMSSHHRRRDVAILRSMGMRLRDIFFFFVAQGAAVGLTGILLGVGFGCLVCGMVERFQPAILSEAVYNVNRLPVRIVVTDVVFICAIAFVLCVVFSVLPALKAALSRPVDAIRYE